MKHAWKQLVGFAVTALAAGYVLLLSVASHAANVSPDDLFLPPSLITPGFYDTHILTVGSGTNVIQTYTNDDPGGTLLGVRILPILNPNPAPTSLEGNYTSNDLANINVSNYTQFFWRQPGTSYVADFTTNVITVNYLAAGQYLVEIAAETNGAQFTNTYVDLVDVAEAGETQQGTDVEVGLSDLGADLYLVSKDPNDPERFTERAYKCFKDEGHDTKWVNNIQDTLLEASNSWHLHGAGTNKVEVAIAAHGHKDTNGVYDGVIVGNNHLGEMPFADMTTEQFQTNIDKWVHSIKFFTCGVGSNDKFVLAMSNSMDFVVTFTGKIAIAQPLPDDPVIEGHQEPGWYMTNGTRIRTTRNTNLTSMWFAPNDGSWTNVNNWGGALVAGGMDNTADFSTLYLTNDVVVTLDGSVIIGALRFRDLRGLYKWDLEPGTGGCLTLVATNGSPAIFVYKPTMATLNVALAGTNGLMKCGDGILVLGASNSFTGPATVMFGILRVGNTSALGPTNDGTAIASGATLDLNGINLGAEPVTASGSGAGGNGAIVNNGAAQGYALQQVTLAGDTTFGGTGLWSIRSASTNNAAATLSTCSNAYNLTKVNTNHVSLIGVQVDPALGDIYVQGGILSIQGLTTSLGNPTHTVMVFSNATLQFNHLTNVLSKVLVLQDGATLNNSGGSNAFGGPTTLNGSNTFQISGGSLTLTNVISGTGTLAKTSGNVLYLSASNTYSGSTLLIGGTLALTNAGSICNSLTITVASGASLDARGRGDETLTLLNGQTLAGSGTIRGSMNVGYGATLSPATGGTNSIGRLTVTNGNLSLAGTTFMELNKALGTNDFICGPTNIAFGGTLIVTNFAGTLAAGDSFKLFDAASYAGSFTNIVPVTPGTGLGWGMGQLTVNGTLRVLSRPSIATASILGGTDFVFTVTNGAAGGQYYVLTSTNVATSLPSWTLIGGGWFDGSGQAAFTNAVADKRRFFIIEVQ